MVDCSGLENRQTLTGFVGPNPTCSANYVRLQVLITYTTTEYFPADSSFSKCPGNAGFDLFACTFDGRPAVELTLHPGAKVKVGCGIRLALPAGFVGLLCSRSGLACNHDVAVVNQPGIIDSSYRGEVCAVLRNNGNVPYTVKLHDRVAQLVVTQLGDVTGLACVPPTVFDNTNPSDRGSFGFGSSGR